MDLKAYYQKMREIAQGIDEEFVVVKSLATPDGGVAGRLCEVRRQVAARMVADGVAELASKQEAEGHRRRAAEEKKQADEKQASAQIQFTVVTEGDLKALRSGGRAGAKE